MENETRPTSPALAPRVLVLEDEPRIAEDLRENLERLGYEVVGPAPSCDAALELIWSVEVDAAILDVTIGEGTCEIVANELSLGQIPWAFASITSSHELQEHFPTTPVIEKPATGATLAEAVASLLDKAKT